MGGLELPHRFLDAQAEELIVEILHPLPQFIHVEVADFGLSRLDEVGLWS